MCQASKNFLSAGIRKLVLIDQVKESVRELQFYRDKLFVTEVVNKNSQA